MKEKLYINEWPVEKKTFKLIFLTHINDKQDVMLLQVHHSTLHKQMLQKYLQIKDITYPTIDIGKKEPWLIPSPTSKDYEVFAMGELALYREHACIEGGSVHYNKYHLDIQPQHLERIIRSHRNNNIALPSYSLFCRGQLVYEAERK